MPEFASWRYASRFGRRRRLVALHAAVATSALAAWSVIGVTAGMGAGLLLYGYLYAGTVLLRDGTAHVARIPRLREEPVLVTRGDLRHLRLLCTRAERGWRLCFEYRFGSPYAELTDLEGLTALALLLPKINRFGARRADLRAALDLLERDPDPETQVSRVASRNTYLDALPRPERLALEMAVHEDTERAAAAGELALLELAWREAEEIAAIADNLLVPNQVHQALEQLRHRALPSPGV